MKTRFICCAQVCSSVASVLHSAPHLLTSGLRLKEQPPPGICRAHGRRQEKPNYAISSKASARTERKSCLLTFHWPKQVTYLNLTIFPPTGLTPGRNIFLSLDSWKSCGAGCRCIRKMVANNNTINYTNK